MLRRPTKIYTVTDPADLVGILNAVAEAAQQGQWVGGFLSYTAACAFGLPVQQPPRITEHLPLAWFAVFTHVERCSLPAPLSIQPLPLLPQMSQAMYADRLATIHHALLTGESYQVNFTLSALLPEEIDLAQLFLAKQSSHRPPYGLWLNTGALEIASFSPELFFHWQVASGQITTAPIKGTRPRYPDPERDDTSGKELETSIKDRAEHIMIVDMARNDLGRICRIGSIKVPHLLERRQFSTLHHLESRVCGIVKPGVTLAEVFAALFPAASVTGAPKYRTMALIRELESQPRGIYTGAIGVICPGGEAIFNVAIRTVVRQKQTDRDRCHIGLGGGIVADSNAADEWREIATKGKFLHTLPVDHDATPVELLETMRMEADGTTPDRSDHLARMAGSAHHLGFNCCLDRINQAIETSIASLLGTNSHPCILRIVLSADGTCRIDSRPLPPPAAHPLRVRLARFVVDRLDRWIRHKTTRRRFLDHALQAARADGFDEVLLGNNLGYLTEGTIRAFIVEQHGQWFTPPLQDGLLPSLWRAQMMQRYPVQEKSLTCADLRQATAVWMGNSIRGTQSVGAIYTADGVLLTPPLHDRAIAAEKIRAVYQKPRNTDP